MRGRSLTAEFQLVLCEIHQLEAEILEVTSGVSSKTYELVKLSFSARSVIKTSN